MRHYRGIATLLGMLVTFTMHAQIFNEMTADGNISQFNESNPLTANFNPNSRDSTKKDKVIPMGVHAWTVDRRFGDISPTELDTMPHLYQNSIYNAGLYGEYNTLGNNFTARQHRVFIDRPQTEEFFFTQPFDFTTPQPDEFLFINTLSPYTHISYDNCGDKQHGEDHIDAKFAVNANKRLGFGFDLDYHYAMGYFQNQNNSNFRGSLFASYIGDRYQMHALYSNYHRKTSENGGITNDQYITHPESFNDQFNEEEIPTVLSNNWAKNNSQHLFLTHRYSVGFYRKVPMTPEEIQARKFAAASAKSAAKRKKDDGSDDSSRPRGTDNERRPMGRPDGAAIAAVRPTPQPAEDGNGLPAAGDTVAVDTTRIRIDSEEALDSMLAVSHQQDSIDETMKKVYVPVTSFIHTMDINKHDREYIAYTSPTDYYANTYYQRLYDNTYGGDSIFDQHRYLSVKNTLAIGLLEGFNKYMKAGIKAFVSHEYRKFEMPALMAEDNNRNVLERWTTNCINIGGQISKTQGQTLHFNLDAELGLTGEDAGSLAFDFSTGLNFRLLGDTVRLAADAFFHRTTPTFLQDNFHSKHLWWEQSLNSETRTHLEGRFTLDRTRTMLRVAVDEIQNYTYFGTSYTLDDNLNRKQVTAGVYQSSGNINVITAQLKQDITLGPLNWENIVTWQNSNSEALPLPDLNVFSNLYLKFMIARVLRVELGGCVSFFTKYKAPDYVPLLGQFAVQQNADSQVEVGGYPFVDVYANMHLKRARFFIAMSHVNAGTGTKNYFLTPHYPTNSRVMHVGVSWNFYN